MRSTGPCSIVLAGGRSSGGTLSMGSTSLYGDNSNTAIRQNAGFYVQDLAGNTFVALDSGGNPRQTGALAFAIGMSRGIPGSA